MTILRRSSPTRLREDRSPGRRRSRIFRLVAAGRVHKNHPSRGKTIGLTGAAATNEAWIVTKSLPSEVKSNSASARSSFVAVKRSILRFARFGIVVALMVSVGCISIRSIADDGTPQVFGLGSVREIPIVEGRLFRVVTPGVSLGTSAIDGSLTIGWHESLVFLPAADSPIQGVAGVETEGFGVAIAPTELSVGYRRAFLIPANDGRSRVQFVAYSAADPSATVVFVRENL